MSIVYLVHEKIPVGDRTGWQVPAGGRFEAGQSGDGSEDSAMKLAVAYAMSVRDSAGREVKVTRTQTSQVWPQSEYRTSEVPLKLEWHKGRHRWEEHDGYPRHQHSINGVLTIAPNDTAVHFAWPEFREAGK
jgi:hypothetical protein